MASLPARNVDLSRRLRQSKCSMSYVSSFLRHGWSGQGLLDRLVFGVYPGGTEACFLDHVEEPNRVMSSIDWTPRC